MYNLGCFQCYFAKALLALRLRSMDLCQRHVARHGLEAEVGSRGLLAQQKYFRHV